LRRSPWDWDVFLISVVSGKTSRDESRHSACPKTISSDLVVKRRNTTKVKTRHARSVKRGGGQALTIARRDSSRVADLKRQVSALTRELVEAREADRRVLHSSAQFAILVQSIKEYAIYMLDSAGHIISWNSGAERIKGYNRDEIIGQHFSRFYIDTDRKTGLPTKALRQAVVDGKFEGEGWRLRKDGSQFWASVVIHPIYNDSKTLIGFAKVTRDVTDRRQAQDLLERKTKDLELFANRLQRERDDKLMNAQAIVAAIAHEVRQPLTRITAGGYAAQRFLKMVPSEHDQVQTALEGIVNAGHRTSEIIDGFRALFAKGVQRQQLVDINETIRGALKLLSSDLYDHDIELRAELAAKLPPVYGNRSQLQQVISNLIENAIEAMENTSNRGRVLFVRSELRDHKAVAVVVKDSGPGIEKNRLDGIFTTFASTKQHGLGLGLAISRMIIDYHGGKLTASSDGKDGASFHFLVPTAPIDKDGNRAETIAT
jgi:PAS domain S-box-containing protein